MFKRARVLMLSTEKASHIQLGMYLKCNSKLYPPNTPLSPFTNQNLYILRDEKPKVGEIAFLDWEGKGLQNDMRYGEVLKIGEDFIHIKNQFGTNESHCELKRFPNAQWCKIIATTDINIEVSDNRFEDRNGIVHVKFLPKPSEDFIKAYTEAYNIGNPIAEVDVEYIQTVAISDKEYNALEEGSLSYKHTNPFNIEILKVDKNNTITIRKIKDSWNREEVVNLMFEALSIGLNGRQRQLQGYEQRTGKEILDNYIKENL